MSRGSGLAVIGWLHRKNSHSPAGPNGASRRRGRAPAQSLARISRRKLAGRESRGGVPVHLPLRRGATLPCRRAIRSRTSLLRRALRSRPFRGGAESIHRGAFVPDQPLRRRQPAGLLVYAVALDERTGVDGHEAIRVLGGSRPRQWRAARQLPRRGLQRLFGPEGSGQGLSWRRRAAGENNGRMRRSIPRAGLWELDSGLRCRERRSGYGRRPYRVLLLGLFRWFGR